MKTGGRNFIDTIINITISAEKGHTALKSLSQKRLEWKEKQSFVMKLPLLSSSVTKTQD